MAEVIAATNDRLSRVADRWVFTFGDLVLRSLEPTMGPDEIEALVRGGRFAEIIDGLDLTHLAKAERPDTLLEAYLRVLVEAGATVRIPGVVAAEIGMSHPQATLWAYRLAAQLLTNVGAETKAAVRLIIARAVGQGGPPRVIAREIYEVTGLDRRGAQAVLHYRQQLEATLAAGRPPAALRSQFSLAPLRAPAATGDRVDGLVDAYRNRLLRRRGENIARTETQTAVHRGQQLVWDATLAEHPDLRPRARRVWIATPGGRTCPTCFALDGAVIGYDESFETDAGGVTVTTQVPPAHPSCRCSEGLRFVD